HGPSTRNLPKLSHATLRARRRETAAGVSPGGARRDGTGRVTRDPSHALVTHRTRPARHRAPRQRAVSPMTAHHVFSVDVEEYFQVNAFEHVAPRETWGDWPKRLG